MDTDKYQAFVKIVELGSFTKAAEQLGYTQAAISHIVNSLEKKWNLTLLLRDRSGVRLTSDAAKLLPLLKQVCLAEQGLLNEVEEIHGLTSGVIKIGSLNSIAVHLLPKIIKIFNIDYPNIDFDIKIGNYSEIEALVVSGQVDFGFTRLPAVNELHSISLGEDRLLVILPKQHPLAKYSKLPLEKIAGEVFLALEEGPEFETKAIFERFNVWPNVKYVSKDDYAIMSMVENELGISILPELILHRTPFKVALRELQEPMYRQLGVVVKDTRHASPAARRFLEYFHANKNILKEVIKNNV